MSLVPNTNILVTGVAGFVGSNLAKQLVAAGKGVIGFDNLCRGSLSHLVSLAGNPLFSFKEVNLADFDAYRTAIINVMKTRPISEVWHMAANSDIPAGIADMTIDLRDTFMTTCNTLKLMNELSIRVIAFASSSAIYGDLGEGKLFEDIGPLFPISNYGAMKLASEAIISSAAESFVDKAYVFRFPNVIGIPATHGVILDFIRKLKATPNNLTVLGDGTQQKNYLHVEELIDAMLFIRKRSSDRRSYFNIGANDAGVTVRYIAEQVVEVVSPGASINYGLGNRGWVGDVPKFDFCVDKLINLGWKPKYGSAQAVARAVKQIAEQEKS